MSSILLIKWILLFISKRDRFNNIVHLGFLSDINECYPSPCENNGACIDGVNDYTCACLPGFEGKNCTISKFFMALRANFCKYRESGYSFKIFNFLIFSPNKAFSELFSKIQLKDPKALEFFQNRGKFENRHFGLPPPLKIDKNDAFSFRSCW